MTADYNTAEEIANAVTHGVGALLAIGGSAVLITLAAVWGDGWQLASAIVFGVTLFLLYLSSTLYHALPHPRAKHVFKIADHCAIFLLIAGTYTPFALIGLNGPVGAGLFVAVWTLACAGIVFKWFFTGRFKGLSTAIYLAMGWIALAFAGPLLEALPAATIGWLFAGGLAYSAGTVFYLSRRPYAHAVWHAFVLAGSVCHYVSVVQHLVVH